MSFSLRGAVRRRALMGIVVAGALGGLFLATRSRGDSRNVTSVLNAESPGKDRSPSDLSHGAIESHGLGHLPPRVPSASCKAGDDSAKTHAHLGDPAARAAAQRGLSFVAANASAWQAEHACYGCHVQAVTLEALTVGRKNQYDVPQKDVDTMLKGLLDVAGGAHDSHGLSYRGGSLLEPAKAFGGAALAHFDELEPTRVRSELLLVSRELVKLQLPDGHVGDCVNGPVAVGPLQTTTQALQTWRQAYDRTADDEWLAPMRGAEGYLQTAAKSLVASEHFETENVDYAIVGLVAAGASKTEDTMQTLAKKLTLGENEDGGWGLTKDSPSTAIATGATLYALRLAGATDEDPAIAKGTHYLLTHQGGDGGWSHGGSSRGEAMWAVLGLVTLDVMSVDIAGIQNGARVDKKTEIKASAKDNGGNRVTKMELAVDDVPLASQCGETLAFSLDASWLGDGAHTVDVTAENARGQTSRRRVQIYAGAYFLTELGTRFEDNGTSVAFRNLAPETMKNEVALRVYDTHIKDGVHARGDLVFTRTEPGAQGAMRMFWNGKDASGKTVPRGTYIAELQIKDASSHVLQEVETQFVNDTVEAQNAQFGAVSGLLDSDGAKGGLANTDVELVDKAGNVVQRVKSTAQGSYHFRNVDRGDYKVRVSKDGFAAQETAVSAAPAATASAPMKLIAK